jgi:hypothetical protein
MRGMRRGCAAQSRGRAMQWSLCTCGVMSRSRAGREAPVRTEPHPTFPRCLVCDIILKKSVVRIGRDAPSVMRGMRRGWATQSRGRAMQWSPCTGGVMSRSRAGREAPVRAEPHPTFQGCLACDVTFQKSIVRAGHSVSQRQTADREGDGRRSHAWQSDSRIGQRDFNSRFSQRLSVDESVSFSPSRHWRSSSMLSGPMRANTWGDSQST